MTTPTAPTQYDDQFWAAIRRDQFYLDPEITFLQGGSVGASPKPVVDKITESIRAFDSDPLKHQGIFHPLVEEARKKLADFVGTRPERIALVQNTTMGMSVPAQGLKFSAGDEIIMTDQEYGAVKMCWEYIAKRHDMLIRIVEMPQLVESDEQFVELYKAQVTDRTKVIVFGHVYWSTGVVTPVKAMTELGREAGAWVIVDGAHAVGMTPVRLDEWNPHFYVTSTHKWLLSAKGTGMLFVSDDAHDHVEPLILGGSCNPNPNASRFDMMGTKDQTPFIGLGTAIDFQNEIGWDNIRAYVQGLTGYLKERLKRIKGARIFTPLDPERSGFLTTFTIDGADIGKIRQELWDEDHIQTTCFHVKDAISFRISTHFYNSKEDIDRLIRGIERRL